MLLGFTTLGGDEPLGGWDIPDRPTALFATTNFDLNTIIASPECQVDLSGVILQLDTPFGVDQFERGREFSEILAGNLSCPELDEAFAQACFPDEITQVQADPGLTVPAATFLNAEWVQFSLLPQDGVLEQQANDIDPGTITWIVNDVVFLPEVTEHAGIRPEITWLASDVVFGPIGTQPRITQLVNDVVFTPLENLPANFNLIGQDATLTYSGA